MDVLGRPIDELGPVNAERSMPIHRDPPSFEELSPSTELLETGIKVIDLVCPFAKGGKVGLFGGAGVGKTVAMLELINNIATQHAVHGAHRKLVEQALFDHHPPSALILLGRLEDEVHGAGEAPSPCWTPLAARARQACRGSR